MSRKRILTQWGPNGKYLESVFIMLSRWIKSCNGSRLSGPEGTKPLILCEIS